ncbi:SbtR family transcriptional regulator [Amycolatopsis pigmentata]|uniref:Transcriptional regulator SbtR-like C-terminal domain-containing protein n=1 Tax=Amycolatopsis pigmentata TaxID=450801 RepID=A0ABW5FXE3_9PSEU
MDSRTSPAKRDRRDRPRQELPSPGGTLKGWPERKRSFNIHPSGRGEAGRRYTAVTRGLAVSLRTTEGAGTCHGLLAEVAAELAATAAGAGRLRPEVTVEDLLAVANGIAIQAEDDPERAGRLLRIALDGVTPRG